MIYFVNVKFIDKRRYVVFRRQIFFLFSPFFYKVEWNAWHFFVKLITEEAIFIIPSPQQQTSYAICINMASTPWIGHQNVCVSLQIFVGCRSSFLCIPTIFPCRRHFSLFNWELIRSGYFFHGLILNMWRHALGSSLSFAAISRAFSDFFFQIYFTGGVGSFAFEKLSYTGPDSNWF